MEKITMSTKTTQDPKGVGRRDFLRGMGLGAGAALTAAAPLATEAMADSENADERKKARYKANAPDIQAFYRVNRYPAKK
ncbi:MAG TPA: formate dehydrogenase [Pseudolabrys sp.]